MKFKPLFSCIIFLVSINSSHGMFLSDEYANASFATILKINQIDLELSKASSVKELSSVREKINDLNNLYIRDTTLLSKQFKLLCSDVASRAKVSEFEFAYEKRMWEMAGAKWGIDSEEEAKNKIVIFWKKYKTKCICESAAFNVVRGNILKYAIAKNSPDFIETLVMYYELDINFVDPADGRNLLDYVNEEIQKMIDSGFSKSSIDVYKKYRELIISIGAKTSK